LSRDIVEKARATLPNQELHVDTLLAAIQKERREAAAMLADAAAVEAAAIELQRDFAQQRRDFEAQLEQERQAAAAAIDDEVKAVRAELRRLRDDVQNVSITKKWMEDAQQRTADLQKSATARIEKQRRPQAPATPAPVVEAKRPIQVGDSVFVASINLTGDVVSIDEGDDSAEVQVGGFRLTVPLRELRPGKAKAEPANTPRPTSIPATPSVALEIDVRGLRAMDACEQVDRYIDDAYRAGLPYVRIIHGKGLGALRQALRDQLNQHRQVKSMTGGGASGGEGVTVVHLNEH
jgi:DNA mismatch repair protein MutS2